MADMWWWVADLFWYMAAHRPFYKSTMAKSRNCSFLQQLWKFITNTRICVWEDDWCGLHCLRLKCIIGDIIWLTQGPMWHNLAPVLPSYLFESDCCGKQESMCWTLSFAVSGSSDEFLVMQKTAFLSQPNGTVFSETESVWQPDTSFLNQLHISIYSKCWASAYSPVGPGLDWLMGGGNQPEPDLAGDEPQYCISIFSSGSRVGLIDRGGNQPKPDFAGDEPWFCLYQATRAGPTWSSYHATGEIICAFRFKIGKAKYFPGLVCVCWRQGSRVPLEFLENFGFMNKYILDIMGSFSTTFHSHNLIQIDTCDTQILDATPLFQKGPQKISTKDATVRFVSPLKLLPWEKLQKFIKFLTQEGLKKKSLWTLPEQGSCISKLSSMCTCYAFITLCWYFQNKYKCFRLLGVPTVYPKMSPGRLHKSCGEIILSFFGGSWGNSAKVSNKWREMEWYLEDTSYWCKCTPLCAFSVHLLWAQNVTSCLVADTLK